MITETIAWAAFVMALVALVVVVATCPPRLRRRSAGKP
jgi:hypothetical protein